MKKAPDAPLNNSANLAKVTLRFTLDDLPDLADFESDEDSSLTAEEAKTFAEFTGVIGFE